MKKLLYCLFVFLIVACASSHVSKTIIRDKSVISDLVLMYYGGSHRKTTWDKDQCMKLVSYKDEKGKYHWMFDGFLLLEFKNGKGRSFASYYEPLPCRQQEWKDLCDVYFKPDVAIHALESCIDEVKKEIGKPKCERKVVITLPEPVPNQKDWGKVDDKVLDFSSDSDRIKACKWYIDYAIEKFKNANLKNLKLDGFYWVAEEATHSRTIVHAVGDYMRSKGMQFYWIPYWGSDGHGEWKDLKFDFAYQQPNYFFYEQKPDTNHLPNVIKFAQDRDMYLELEFDERALRKNSDYRADRLRDYINAFDKANVLYTTPIAYYIGDKMVYDLAVSDSVEDNELYNWFAKIIVKRQQIRGEK